MKWPAFLTTQVVTLAVAGGFAFLWVGARNAARSAEARAAKADEAKTLADADLAMAKVETADAIRRGSYLADELGKALAKLHVKPAVIFSGTGTTGPVTVGGDALAGSSLPAPQAAQASPAAGLPPPAAGAPACLLHAGEQGEVRVSVAGAETDAGNVVVKGEAEAWRLSPDARLFGGPLRLDVKVSPQEPGPRAAGWGYGAATVLTRSGVTVGPAVAAPILSLPFRFQAEASAAVTLNPRSNEWAGTAQVVFRRR